MRKGVVPALAIAMTMPANLSARCDEIPTLDAGPVCRGIANQSGDSLEAGLGSTSEQCVQSEQMVREQLRKEWSTFSAADKRHCVTLSKIGGESSYTELLTCLEMARDVRTYRSAATSGKATTRAPSSSSASSLSSLYLSSSSPSPSPSSSAASSRTSIHQAKVDAINARASESMAQGKIADAETKLKQAKDEAAKATKEAQQAKADAQSERQTTEANLKQAKDEAAKATKEAQQARADAQAALQSKAEAERKLAVSEADPLGAWLRGLSAWLRGLVSSFFA
jgi:hypothetical protein